MNKRTVLLFLMLVLTICVGVVLGQGVPGDPFTTVREIGRIRPRSIQYDPNFDRIAMVDSTGHLLLVNAADFAIQAKLYNYGMYSDYVFSHDGRLLAVAIDKRVDLWDTQDGTLRAALELDGTLSMSGGLEFASDDKLLLMNTVVRAPQALRRSENDTSIMPWLWDLPSALDEGRSSLPNYVEAYNFPDFRNGFVLGPNDKVLAALPQRFQVIDVADTSLPVIGEIASDRNERDPITVWYSQRDDLIYVRPMNQSNLTQINTQTGALVDLPVGYDLDYNDIPMLEDMILGDQARIIGQPNSRSGNPFLSLLLGSDYRQNWRYHPLTVTLIDILKPVTMSSDQMGLLILIRDEETGRAMIDFLRPVDIWQMVLHPDNIHFMVRRASGEQPIEVYNLQTGGLEKSIVPALSDPDGSQILAYNNTGDVIISDFQRFDAATGAVLYQDLDYAYGFDSYYFTEDSQKLVTLRGSEWWLWDIATGEVIRRERVVFQGELWDTTDDGHRFLTRIDTSNGPGFEVVDIGTGERHSVVFDTPPGDGIIDTIPSPDWENYLVVYSTGEYSPYYPGNEIALYNLYEGKRWLIAGDDLPNPDGRSYGWIDNQTVYVSSGYAGGSSQPARIYGLDYDASGLPACLVTAFPDDWSRWVDVWEWLNANMRADKLGLLTQRLCDALPAAASDIDSILTPTPTATPPAVTPGPSVIAGVPACLTQRYSGEALEYAELWRQMTANVSPEEEKELEALLCEGLDKTSISGRGGYASEVSDIEVMTIDIRTGVRETGTYFPAQEDTTPSLQVVQDAYRRMYNTELTDPVLSPDGQLVASRALADHVIIKRLPRPYADLAATATATVAGLFEEPNLISMLPTPTRGFDWQGQPHPTLTPTVTPTSPPPASQVADLPDIDTVEGLCPSDSLYDIANPPPGYDASGRLIVSLGSSPVKWTLDTATGQLHPDETIPRCGWDVSCTYSFDQNWILIWGEEIVVSRNDGRDAQVLFEQREQAAWPNNIYWLNNGLVEYSYEGYLPDQFADPVMLYQHIDPASGKGSEPFLPQDAITVNNLYTEIVSQQPDNGSLAVVRTGFNTGQGWGYKYYIYDRDSGSVDYFARLAGSYNQMEFAWHPLGDALYYRYPDSEDWYVFDAATREHRLLGNLPGGEWSRDGRYRVEWVMLSEDEIREHVKNNQPLPKLSIWDRQTGLTRRYCIPRTGLTTFSEMLHWSPDNRYLAFYIPLTDYARDIAGGEFSAAIGPTATLMPAGSGAEPVSMTRWHTLMLDIETGSVTDLGVESGPIEVWADNPGGEQP